MLLAFSKKNMGENKRGGRGRQCDEERADMEIANLLTQQRSYERKGRGGHWNNGRSEAWDSARSAADGFVDIAAAWCGSSLCSNTNGHIEKGTAETMALAISGPYNSYQMYQRLKTRISHRFSKLFVCNLLIGIPSGNTLRQTDFSLLSEGRMTNILL